MIIDVEGDFVHAAIDLELGDDRAFVGLRDRCNDDPDALSQHITDLFFRTLRRDPGVRLGPAQHYALANVWREVP